MELIPAIDLIEGKCVRLTQGDYSTRKVYKIRWRLLCNLKV